METLTTEPQKKEQAKSASELNAELITDKEPKQSPNKNTRFSVQIIAFNEIESTNSTLTRLPNLVTHLISIVSACDALLSTKREERAEVLVNINNKPGAITLGNLRSKNLFRLLQAEAPPSIENLPIELDWLPSYQDALKDKRKMQLILAHYKLIRNIHRLKAHGFQFHMIDCTDGATFVGKNKTPQFTQGARRALLSEIAYKRLEGINALDSGTLMFPLDADAMIKPATFVLLAKEIEKFDSKQPLLFRESVKVINDKSEFIGNLSKLAKNNMMLRTIESFTKVQLDFLQKIVTSTEQFVTTHNDLTTMQRQEQIDYRNLLYLQLDLETLLAQNGFTKQQITLLLTISPENVSKLLGEQVKGSERSHFYQKIKLIKMLLNSKGFAENLNRSLSVTRILEALSTHSGKPATIILPAFIGSYLFNARAYEKSPWDYEVDKGEDQAIIEKLYKSSRVIQLSEQLVTVRDRIRVESWVGGTKKRYNSTYEDTGKAILARQTQTWLRNNGFSELGDELDVSSDLLATLLSNVMEFINTMSSTFSKRKLEQLKKLNEMYKKQHNIDQFTSKVVEFISTMKE